MFPADSWADRSVSAADASWELTEATRAKWTRELPPVLGGAQPTDASQAAYAARRAPRAAALEATHDGRSTLPLPARAMRASGT